MKRLKIITMVMILVMSMQSASYGATLCFNNISTMQKFTTDLKDYNTNLPITQKDLVLCNQEVTILKNKETINLQLVQKLNEDKIALNLSYKETKDSLINKQKELDKALEDKPSRLTWWLIGVGSALLVGLLGAIAVK